MALGVDDHEGWMQYITEMAAVLGVDPNQVPVDSLLDLAGEVARRAYRPMAPVTGYLIGLAVGAGMSPADAITKVNDALPAEQE